MLQEKYSEYLNEHKELWSKATLKSEHSRLKNFYHLLSSPYDLFIGSKELAPYSRKTLFIRVSSFFDWLVSKGIEKENPYPAFIKKNFRAFQYAYEKKPLKLSYSEVKDRVSSLKNERVKHIAETLLKSGLRFHELALVKDGQVRGKGGKIRPVRVGALKEVPYITFYTHLKQVGLKPHDLRKAALNHLVDLGASNTELMEIAGWSNLNTAQSYISANESRVDHLLEEMSK